MGNYLGVAPASRDRHPNLDETKPENSFFSKWLRDLAAYAGFVASGLSIVYVQEKMVGEGPAINMSEVKEGYEETIGIAVQLIALDAKVRAFAASADVSTTEQREELADLARSFAEDIAHVYPPQQKDMHDLAAACTALATDLETGADPKDALDRTRTCIDRSKHPQPVTQGVYTN